MQKSQINSVAYKITLITWPPRSRTVHGLWYTKVAIQLKRLTRQACLWLTCAQHQKNTEIPRRSSIYLYL